MHGYTHSPDLNFLFDGGFDGDVIIRKRKEDGSGIEEMVVPAEALIKLIAYNYVMPRKMSEIEMSSPDKLLGVTHGGLVGS